MDGLSSAASAIAVISIAVQIAESSLKLYYLLEQVKDSTRDIQRLNWYVLQLHKMLDGVRNLLEIQKNQDKIFPPAEDFHNAFKVCRESVSTLREYALQLHRRSGEKGLRRVKGLLMIAADKGKIAKFSTEVQEAIQILGVAIATNQSLLSLAQINRTELAVSHLRRGQVATTERAGFGPVAVADRSKIVWQEVKELRLGLGVYRSRTIWTKRFVDDSWHWAVDVGLQKLDYCTTITFTPLVSEQIFAFQTERILGQIGRYWRVYVIDHNLVHSIFDELGSSRSNATALFRRHLSEGLNPFLLDRKGRSMLFYAVQDSLHGVVETLLQCKVGMDGCLDPAWNQWDLFRQIYVFKPSVPEDQRSTDAARMLAAQKSRNGYCVHTRSFEDASISIYQDSTQQFLGYTLDSVHSDMLRFRLATIDDCTIARDMVIDIMESKGEIQDWKLESRVDLITFVFDTIVEEQWMLSKDYVAIGQLLLGMSVQECDLQGTIDAWLHLISQRGLDTTTAVGQLLASIPQSTTLGHMWKRKRYIEASDEGIICRWKYDERERAVELSREFECLLLNQYFTDRIFTWPHMFTPWRQRRTPRRFKKARRHRLTRLQDGFGSELHIPGSFPVEAEEPNHLCDLHCQPLPCFLCRRSTLRHRPSRTS